MSRVGLLLAIVVGAAVVAFVYLNDDTPGAAHKVNSHAPGATSDEPSAPRLRGSLAADPDNYIASDYVRRTRDATPTRLTFFGSVVSSKYKPVIGAELSVQTQAGTIATATTNDDGSYSFVAEMVPGGGRFDVGTVEARAPSGAYGYAEFEAPAPWLVPEVEGEDGIAIPTIKLSPHGGSLHVQVITSCEYGLPARVRIDAHPSQGSRFVSHWTDVDGSLTIRGLPRCAYRVTAASPGCGRVSRALAIVGNEEKRLELEVPEAHTIKIRVCETGSETPVPDARIAVADCIGDNPLRDRAPHWPGGPGVYADEHGEATLDGLGPEDRVWLRASSESYGVESDAWAIASVTDEEVTLELPRKRTITWKLVDRGHGVPADGSEVSISKNDHESTPRYPDTAFVEGDTIKVTGWPPGKIDAHAHIAGSGAAMLRAAEGATRGEDTSFYPLRTMHLIATEADGSPAVGATLYVRAVGLVRGVAQALTNDQGQATIEGLMGGPGAKAFWSVGRRSHRRSMRAPAPNEVSIEDRDVTVRYTFPAKFRMVVTLRVQGRKPPADIVGTVTVSNRYKDGSGSNQRVTKTIQGAGVCEVEVGADEDVESFVVHVRSPGYEQLTPCVVPASEALVSYAAVSLKRTYAAVVQVDTPVDRVFRIRSAPYPEGQRELPTIGQTTHWFRRSRRAETEGSIQHVMRLEGLSPGRHVAYDELSGTMSDPFRVGDGESPPRVSLDLSRVGWVTGRVIPPSGEIHGQASVEVVERQVAGSLRVSPNPLLGVYANPVTGGFRVRSNGVAPITLVVHSSRYRPHPTQGRVTVTSPRTGVELRLVEGSRATIHFDRSIHTVSPEESPAIGNSAGILIGDGKGVLSRLPHVSGTTTVVITSANGERQQLRAELSRDGRSITFAGHSPGRYSIWVDTLTFAPLKLSGVILTTSDQDLGTHALTLGSRIVMNASTADVERHGPFRIRVTSTKSPFYTRYTQASSLSALSLAGLGPGTFRLMVHSVPRPDISLSETITLDGKSNLSRTISLP